MLSVNLKKTHISVIKTLIFTSLIKINELPNDIQISYHRICPSFNRTFCQQCCRNVSLYHRGHCYVTDVNWYAARRNLHLCQVNEWILQNLPTVSTVLSGNSAVWMSHYTIKDAATSQLWTDMLQEETYICARLLDKYSVSHNDVQLTSWWSRWQRCL